MVRHTTLINSRLDPVFFLEQAPNTCNAIRDHRATEKPRKNQQKIIQTATTGCVGCTRRDGVSAAATSAATRVESCREDSGCAGDSSGHSPLLSRRVVLKATAKHSWSGCSGGARSDDPSVFTAVAHDAVCPPVPRLAAWRTTRSGCRGRWLCGCT